MKSPWNYTVDELIAYCDDHADPIVREAIKLAYDAKKEFEDEIRELESNLKYAEEERDASAERATYADSKYKALKLDNDEKYAIKEIFRLKAEVMELLEENRDLKKEVVKHLREIDNLEGKLDTWTAIAT